MQLYTAFYKEKVVVPLFRADENCPSFHNGKRKLGLLVALAPLWGVHRVFRGFYIRTNVVHREALILFTGALRTLSQVLL